MATQQQPLVIDQKTKSKGIKICKVSSEPLTRERAVSGETLIPINMSMTFIIMKGRGSEKNANMYAKSFIDSYNRIIKQNTRI